MEELLPCPFCGNTNILVETAAEIEGVDENDGYYQAGSKFHAAICCMNKKGCGATGRYRQTRDEAAADWNRRAQEQPNNTSIIQALDFFKNHLKANLKYGERPAIRTAMQVLCGQMEKMNEPLTGPLKIGDSVHGMKIIGLDALAGTITLSGWKPFLTSQNGR